MFKKILFFGMVIYATLANASDNEAKRMSVGSWTEGSRMSTHSASEAQRMSVGLSEETEGHDYIEMAYPKKLTLGDDPSCLSVDQCFAGIKDSIVSPIFFVINSQIFDTFFRMEVDQSLFIPKLNDATDRGGQVIFVDFNSVMKKIEDYPGIIKFLQYPFSYSIQKDAPWSPLFKLEEKPSSRKKIELKGIGTVFFTPFYSYLQIVPATGESQDDEKNAHLFLKEILPSLCQAFFPTDESSSKTSTVNRAKKGMVFFGKESMNQALLREKELFAENLSGARCIKFYSFPETIEVPQFPAQEEPCVYRERYLQDGTIQQPKASSKSSGELREPLATTDVAKCEKEEPLIRSLSSDSATRWKKRFKKTAGTNEAELKNQESVETGATSPEILKDDNLSNSDTESNSSDHESNDSPAVDFS